LCIIVYNCVYYCDTGSNTFFGKTASLLQGDDEMGNFQKVLLKIVIVLVILSFTLSGIVFGFLLGKTQKSLSIFLSFILNILLIRWVLY
jgi:magnesium-transporting ATPase (P-type)